MPDQHVLDHAHALEDAQHLEGARDAEPRDLVRLLAGDVLAVEHDAGAGLGLVDAGNQVEERALARAVRPDDAAHLALLHGQIDLRDGGEAAEPLGQVLDLKQHRRPLLLRTALRLALADRLEAPPHEEVVDDAADAARHEDDHQHDHRAEHQHAVLVVVAREVVDDRHDDRADHAAPDVADAAEHHHQQQRHHLDDGVVVRVQEAGRHVRHQAAGAARVERADHEGDHLVFRHVDAARRGRERVLADRLEGAADVGGQDAEREIEPEQRRPASRRSSRRDGRRATSCRCRAAGCSRSRPRRRGTRCRK